MDPKQAQDGSGQPPSTLVAGDQAHAIEGAGQPPENPTPKLATGAQAADTSAAGQPPGGKGVQRRDDRGPARWRGARTPFELMARMDEDMERMFRRFWGGAHNPWRGRGAGGDMAQQMWAPQVEVFERDGKLHVHADLPGMRKEDVKLSIDDDQLVIQGERRSSHDSSSQPIAGYFHSERSYGSFYRTVPLPEGVDTSTAEASFDDGVLKVHFAAPQAHHGKKRDLEIR